MATTVDGIIRRWLDVFWTASARLRQMDPEYIRHVYFYILIVYFCLGLFMLWANKPTALIKYATLGYNFALGFSCFHNGRGEYIAVAQRAKARMVHFASGSFWAGSSLRCSAWSQLIKRWSPKVVVARGGQFAVQRCAANVARSTLSTARPVNKPGQQARSTCAVNIARSNVPRSTRVVNICVQQALSTTRGSTCGGSNRNAVELQSPGSRSAPWGTAPSTTEEPQRGSTNCGVEPRWGSFCSFATYPGCSARPWAMKLNAVGVRALALGMRLRMSGAP